MAKKKTTSKKKSRTAKKPSQTKVDQPSTAAELWEHFKPLYDSLPYDERWRFISSTEYIYGLPESVDLLDHDFWWAFNLGTRNGSYGKIMPRMRDRDRMIEFLAPGGKKDKYSDGDIVQYMEDHHPDLCKTDRRRKLTAAVVKAVRGRIRDRLERKAKKEAERKFAEDHLA